MGRQDKAMGLWSWLCCPGLTAPRRSVMLPRAGRPSNRTTMGRLLVSGRSFYPPASASPPRGQPI